MKWLRGRSVNVDLRRIIGILVMLAVLAVLAGLIGAVSAQSTVEPSKVFHGWDKEGSPVALRIFTEKSCTNSQVISYLMYRFGVPPMMLRQFKASVLTWKGKDWASCWIEQQGWVLSVDEEDAPFESIPMSAMREESL